MIFVLYIVHKNSFAFKRLPSWAFQTIRWIELVEREREWQHHKKKNLVPCKAFLIRVRSSSSMGIVCWGEDECAKKMSFGSLLSCSSFFVAIFGSHSRGGAFESWTLWARRPTLWGIHLAICESQQSPPLLTNLSSRHISQAYTTAVCLSISQFFVKYE